MSTFYFDASRQYPDGDSIRGHAILSETEWLIVAQQFRLSKREAQLVKGAFDDESESAIGARLDPSRVLWKMKMA